MRWLSLHGLCASFVCQPVTVSKHESVFILNMFISLWAHNIGDVYGWISECGTCLVMPKHPSYTSSVSIHRQPKKQDVNAWWNACSPSQSWATGIGRRGKRAVVFQTIPSFFFPFFLAFLSVFPSPSNGADNHSQAWASEWEREWVWGAKRSGWIAWW